jgi:hypothetical protein
VFFLDILSHRTSVMAILRQLYARRRTGEEDESRKSGKPLTNLDLLIRFHPPLIFPPEARSCAKSWE